jgi:hypothetical protein
MKIYDGKRVKSKGTLDDFPKGEKYSIEIQEDKSIEIDGNVITKEMIEKHFIGLKPLPKPIEVITRKVRILYPWLRTDIGKSYKYMLALIADQGWDRVLSGDINYCAYLKEVIEKTNKIFPEMYSTVAKFYKDKGRIITEKQFIPIAMGRLTMMFRVDKEEGKVERLHEHPEFSPSKFADVIEKCQKLIKKAEK